MGPEPPAPRMTGAPAFVVFGAYFPGWMLCALLGILASLVLRAGFVAVGIDQQLPLRLFVYLAAAMLIGGLLWLEWFGP